MRISVGVGRDRHRRSLNHASLLGGLLERDERLLGTASSRLAARGRGPVGGRRVPLGLVRTRPGHPPALCARTARSDAVSVVGHRARSGTVPIFVSAKMGLSPSAHGRAIWCDPGRWMPRRACGRRTRTAPGGWNCSAPPGCSVIGATRSAARRWPIDWPIVSSAFARASCRAATKPARPRRRSARVAARFWPPAKSSARIADRSATNRPSARSTGWRLLPSRTSGWSCWAFC